MYFYWLEEYIVGSFSFVHFDNDSDPSKAVLQLKSYEALAQVADGNATKIFLPQSLMSEASSAVLFGEMFQDAKEKPSKKSIHYTSKPTPDQELQMDHEVVVTKEDDEENVEDISQHTTPKIKPNPPRYRG